MTTLHRPPTAARLLAATAALVAATLTLAGCTGSSSKPAASASTGAPVTLSGPTVASAGGGIRLRLPAGWRQVPLGTGQDAALSKIFHSRSRIADIDQQIRFGQFRGLQLFAVQPRANGRPGTLGVAINRATSTTLDGLQKALLIGTEQVADTTPAFDRVSLPSGRSLRVHYRLTDGDSTTQYYVLAGPIAFTLTVTTPDHDPDLRVDDAVARSMRLSNAA